MVNIMESVQRFTVRSMKADELARVAKLICDLQEYQKIKNCPRLPTYEDLKEELVYESEDSNKQAPNNRGTFAIVAVDNEKERDNNGNKEYIIGYLIYSQVFSIKQGRHFYMNSFFIQENYRRHGLGKKFMEFMRLHAVSAGIRIVDIPFMNNNLIGQKFYSNYGSYLVNEEYIMMGRPLE